MKKSIQWMSVVLAGVLCAGALVPSFADSTTAAQEQVGAQHQLITPEQAKAAVEKMLAKRHMNKWTVSAVAQTPTATDEKAPAYQVTLSGPKDKKRTVLVNAWTGKMMAVKHPKGDRAEHKQRQS